MEILRLESDYIKLYSVGIEHKYKGSSNQRIINVKQTIECKNIVEIIK